MSDLKEKAKRITDTIKKGGKAIVEEIPEKAKAVGEVGKKAVAKTKDTIIEKIDQDGNGMIDSFDLIIMALRVPGVRIKRDVFLQKELYKYCQQGIIDEAIKTTPAKAGIDKTIIDKIADEVIIFERNAVSGISAGLGIPGGVAMVATIPADIAQYYGFMLRAAQKLLYLYGFPAISTSEEGVNLDSETMNSLTVCLGVMYGIAGANNAIKAMARALAVGIEKQLLQKALTKGTIYPFVKVVAKWFGQKMTKKVFAGFFKKTIPVVGGVIAGGLTFATFKPCCNRLKNALQDTLLSNPEHVETEEEKKIFEDIQSGVIVDDSNDEGVESEPIVDPDDGDDNDEDKSEDTSSP